MNWTDLDMNRIINNNCHQYGLHQRVRHQKTAAVNTDSKANIKDPKL